MTLPHGTSGMLFAYAVCVAGNLAGMIVARASLRRLLLIPLYAIFSLIVILRCSASEDGGTARFASRMIGEREIIRQHVTKTHNPDKWLATKTESKQYVIESAVLPSEIEQLPDLHGYLKFGSQPEWRRVKLAAPT